MDGLERIWATWRREYVSGETGEISTASDGQCVLCSVLDLRNTEPDKLVYCGETAAVILNAYPYNTGHVMVLPYEHVPDFEELDQKARMEIFDLITRSISAVESSYSPDGINMGANLGRGAGAGIPDHLHVHVLPRWDADTNFMTTVGGARVLPEDLDSTLRRLKEAFD
ncbi:MAG TPA: HIT family hydrolase [Acidimicrobiaceae bacterium]|nr:HIT family hydrolase [Acidimicrobiaceae bacterium]|tara:strand:- start:719 stop:1225 length:507 start_codon:yes stop_codon:yes gene_type:complete